MRKTIETEQYQEKIAQYNLGKNTSLITMAEISLYIPIEKDSEDPEDVFMKEYRSDEEIKTLGQAAIEKLENEIFSNIPKEIFLDGYGVSVVFNIDNIRIIN
jgi:hypothetical protein